MEKSSIKKISISKCDVWVLWVLILIAAFLGPVVFAGDKTATVTSDGNSATIKATPDSGASDSNGTAHPSEVDRDTAKKLGLLDANGNADPNSFQKDPNGHRKRKITWNNDEKWVEKSVKMPSAPNNAPTPPTSGGQQRSKWPSRYRNVDPEAIEGEAFIGLGSPYTVLAYNTAVDLNLPLEEENRINLERKVDTLYLLWKAGFISKNNDYGIFYLEQLPQLEFYAADGITTIRYENVEVLVPYGHCAEEPYHGALIGSELIEEYVGYICQPNESDVPVGQITFLAEFEEMWFTPAAPRGDLDDDLDVDLCDLAVLVDNWLEDTGIH